MKSQLTLIMVIPLASETVKKKIENFFLVSFFVSSLLSQLFMCFSQLYYSMIDPSKGNYILKCNKSLIIYKLVITPKCKRKKIIISNLLIYLILSFYEKISHNVSYVGLVLLSRDWLILVHEIGANVACLRCKNISSVLLLDFRRQLQCPFTLSTQRERRRKKWKKKSFIKCCDNDCDWCLIFLWKWWQL